MTIIDTYCEACALSSDIEMLKSMGFKGGIVEETSNRNIKDDFILGTRRTISSDVNFDDVKSALIKAREEVDVVVLNAGNEFVLKRLSESSTFLFDVLSIKLNDIHGLKPVVIKKLLENTILEINISQFLVNIQERAKLLSNARQVVRTLVGRRKGMVRLILCGGGKRDPLEIISVGRLCGLREKDAYNAVSSEVFLRLIKESKSNKLKFQINLEKVARPIVSKKRERPHENEQEEVVKRKLLSFWS